MAITIIDPTVLPFVSTFLFVFALVFGLLSYIKLGEFDKKVNAILALAIAAFAVMYEPLVVLLQQYMPIAAGLLILLFFVALVKKMFSGKEGKSGRDTFPMVLSIAVLMLILVTFSDSLTSFIPGGFDPNLVFWIIGILFVILFFVGIYKYKGASA